MSLPFRSRVEHASAPWIDKLNGMPRVLPFLVVLALMLAGAFVPKVGFLFTLLIAVFLGWILFLTWPRLGLPEKLLRFAVLGMVLAMVAVQAFPR
ncbi:MAG TPA: hypothetical protein P5181_04530 [Dermatophilaceae bacterium]|nr:hypothetical protein [Dermatophilaceae bacterium]